MSARPAAPTFTKHILKLAHQIDASSAPDYVPVSPEMECLPGRCFENVTEIVKRRGGSVQYGWSMREQPAVYVDAAFHAVWRCTNGALIDVTPRTDGQTQIVFLPDSKRVWKGKPVETRQMFLHGKPCYCGSGMPFRICHGLGDD
ncbi:MAG: hypothetical protein QOE70_6350 [Chthoniobacter sp.]|jgi:hypothetical protein|nr:hypothetical protein [Chthoniobacter sp.]